MPVHATTGAAQSVVYDSAPFDPRRARKSRQNYAIAEDVSDPTLAARRHGHCRGDQRDPEMAPGFVVQTLSLTQSPGRSILIEFVSGDSETSFVVTTL
jgi:hypothetical protein